MKVVLDTNVLIDGFKDEYSYEYKIIQEVIDGGLEAYANHGTLRENKLLSKQLIDSNEYEQKLADFFAQINDIHTRKTIHVVRDPEDNKILESAVEANAEFLITRDNDLLELESYQGVQIITPSAFWVQYKDEGADLWKQWTNFINKK